MVAAVGLDKAQEEGKKNKVVVEHSEEEEAYEKVGAGRGRGRWGVNQSIWGGGDGVGRMIRNKIA
jgi:hypothetical protein